MARDLHQAPFTLVLLIELVGVVSVAIAPQHWLRAVGVLAAGVLAAGLLRLVLTDEQAGLLRVRRRSVDVAFYWAFGIAAILVAVGLPQR